MSVILQPHVEERLRSDEMIWLLTVRPDSRPHGVPVWFLWEEPTVLIFSKPNNQKIRNLRENSAVSLAFDNTKNGSDVAILEGTAELVEPGDRATTLQAYGDKYRAGLQKIGVTVEIFTALYSQLIRITPNRLLTGQ
jgi:PPOX class probable F420-dependent enzyme